MVIKAKLMHDLGHGGPPEWTILCLGLSRRWRYLQVERWISECRGWHMLKQSETWTDGVVDGMTQTWRKKEQKSTSSSPRTHRFRRRFYQHQL